MKIRPCHPADLPAVMDIGNRAWEKIRHTTRKELGADLYDRLHPNPETEKGRQIEQHVQAHPDWAMVCEANGHLVGFITFAVETESGIGEILNNAVDPNCGLKGVGQIMYKAVLDHFRELGLTAARVDTGLDPAHRPARNAYERAGFDRKLEHVTYYLSLQD